MTATLTAKEFIRRLKALAAPDAAAAVGRAQGDDHVSLGIRMGDIFALAKEFTDLPPAELDRLLDSPVHDVRVGALSIMGKQYLKKQTTPERRQELYELYLRRIDRVNSWDLVDLSGHQVIGGHLYERPREPLYELAASPEWPQRRLAIFATLHFVRKGDADDTFALAEILIDDDEPLVQKAVGGLLREAGKVDRAQLLAFLDRHAATAPRVTLRYAIEHLEPAQRTHYLGLARTATPGG